MTPEQERKARRWEIPAVAVALLVVPYLVLNHFHPDDTWVDVIAYVIWGFFVVEALAILRLSPSKTKWAERNVLDVAVIVLSTPIPGLLDDRLDVFQVIWLARILDLLPVIHRLVFRITVVRFALILWALVALGGALAFTLLEPGQDLDLFEGFYWANTTLSTVGYGDISPETVEGRVLTMLVQVAGPVIGAILVAGIIPVFDDEFAAGFSRRVGEAVERLTGEVDELDREIDDLVSDVTHLSEGERAQTRLLLEIRHELSQLRGGDGRPAPTEEDG